MTTYLYATKKAKEIIDRMTDYQKESLMSDIRLDNEVDEFIGYVDDMGNVNVRLSREDEDVSYHECYEENK